MFCIVSATPAYTGAAAEEKWVASWAAAQHGPYPSGIATAGPDLRFAFPDAAVGATDQTFRLIVKPDLWGNRVRLRFSNVYGDPSGIATAARCSSTRSLLEFKPAAATWFRGPIVVFRSVATR